MPVKRNIYNVSLLSFRLRKDRLWIIVTTTFWRYLCETCLDGHGHVYHVTKTPAANHMK